MMTARVPKQDQSIQDTKKNAILTGQYKQCENVKCKHVFQATVRQIMH